MNKNHIILSTIFLLGADMVNAQSARTYVQQNDTKVEAVGTAAFELDNTPTVEFVDGKAVMTIGDNTVATLPVANNGQLAVDFKTAPANVTKTVSNGYATVYSPFELVVPSGDVEAYAPTYDSDSHLLKLTDDTKVAAGAVVPVGTGLILRYDEETATSSNNTIEFSFSSGASTDTHTSALSGSALTIANPTKSAAVDGKTVYTLGHEETTNEYGFFAYTGDNLNAGLAYLLTETVAAAQGAKAISFSFEDGVTAVEEIENGKLETGNSAAYNVAGQRVGKSYSGVVIINGKKYLSK